jgi:hypothetical protein
LMRGPAQAAGAANGDVMAATEATASSAERAARDANPI